MLCGRRNILRGSVRAVIQIPQRRTCRRAMLFRTGELRKSFLPTSKNEITLRRHNLTNCGLEMDAEIDLSPRRCMREPISEIFDAARLLNSATDAHLTGDRVTADSLLRAANMPVLRAWIESLIGSKAANPDQSKYHRSRKIPDAPPILEKVQRIKKREPSREERRLIIQRYGRNCVFCGIPVISDQVRKAFQPRILRCRAVGSHQRESTRGVSMYVDAVRSCPST